MRLQAGNEFITDVVTLTFFLFLQVFPYCLIIEYYFLNFMKLICLFVTTVPFINNFLLLTPNKYDFFKSCNILPEKISDSLQILLTKI